VQVQSTKAFFFNSSFYMNRKNVGPMLTNFTCDSLMAAKFGKPSEDVRETDNEVQLNRSSKS